VDVLSRVRVYMCGLCWRCARSGPHKRVSRVPPNSILPLRAAWNARTACAVAQGTTRRASSHSHARVTRTIRTR
jgi:hypothetical protein